MHTLRAITDQINIVIAHNGNNSIVPPQTGGYLVLRCDDSNSAVYFFSTGDFQSWYDPNRSNIARIYFGPARNDPNNLALDMLLLTPGYPSVLDYRDVSFAQCQADIVANFEDPNIVLSADRPDINMARDPNDARRLLAQRVGSFKIEWTYGWTRSNEPNRIVWWGLDDVGDPNALRDEKSLIKEPNGVSILPVEIIPIANAINETKGPPYTVWWDSTNQQYWPKALKFTFTLYDSRGLFKNGRKFEHIVYIGP
jgi:hypothetical protein